MDWNEIDERLKKARDEFLKRDRYLLEVNANERSMTHKFAEYLQRGFSNWHVDCEYNRDGKIPKQLFWLRDKHVSCADENATTVFPDIIVHLRGAQCCGESRNLLVIEAKKSLSANTDDERKLRAFQIDHFRYQYGVRLLFIVGSEPDIKYQRC